MVAVRVRPASRIYGLSPDGNAFSTKQRGDTGRGLGDVGQRAYGAAFVVNVTVCCLPALSVRLCFSPDSGS